MPSERDVMLTVFMEGTANPMDAITTQIALFSRLCIATPLAIDGSSASQVQKTPGHYKLCFPGCGVSHGIQGTLFALGLREQCGIVRTYVEAFLGAGHTVKVNFAGLSRGGIGGLYLAQELDGFRAEQVLLNLLLFDPVPGNLVWMARFCDWSGHMNANQAMDVSSARNLGRVVVLYPHEPLPAIAVHAPLIATFPEGCQPELDVILGCHQGALFLRPRADTCLAFARIRDFLLECGSRIDRGRGAARELDLPEWRLADQLEAELQVDAPTTRCSHALLGGRLIVRHSHGTYLNRTHEALLRRLGEPPRPDGGPGCPMYMLDIA